MTGRTYKDAIVALNSLQSNAAVLADIRLNWHANAHKVIPETLEYLGRAGYQPDDLSRLNVLHITGTKGKGSTSAFCSSILGQIYPSRKIGLYTSPHLVAVRERIRINGRPLAEDLFARYFFELWDRFGTVTKDDLPPRPAYARFLTILAFHVFACEKVDATVLEVGIGGTYDATNVVPRPIAAGVTALGIDHVAILGSTLAQIAHQKGGIFKAGVPALSVQQPREGLDVLQARAKELAASPLRIIPSLDPSTTPPLGLAGSHQLSNAALAIALVREYMAVHPPSLTATEADAAIAAGLQSTRWPGRCQIVERPGATWYLDGAHTIESLAACAGWFVGASREGRKRVLIFNCTSDRTGAGLLAGLYDCLLGGKEEAARFDRVIFTTNSTYRGGASKGDLANVAVDTRTEPNTTSQQMLADAWSKMARSPSTTTADVTASIEEALEIVEQLRARGDEVEVLVTGSLHLIGGVMIESHKTASRTCLPSSSWPSRRLLQLSSARLLSSLILAGAEMREPLVVDIAGREYAIAVDRSLAYQPLLDTLRGAFHYPANVHLGLFVTRPRKALVTEATYQQLVFNMLEQVVTVARIDAPSAARQQGPPMTEDK